MLKHFQLVSDPLVYSGGLATFTIPQILNGNSRVAIIGISARGPAALPAALMFNQIERFEIAGRQYHQGDPCPLALVAGGLIPVPDQSVATPSIINETTRGFFPGTMIPLSDGSTCGGFLLVGAEQITISIRSLHTTLNISEIVLHCVEFGLDPQNDKQRGLQAFINEKWDRFVSGIGQVHWQVTEGAITDNKAFQTQFQAQVFQPHGQRVRRRELRGVQILENAASSQVMEIDFVTATAQVKTNQQPASSSVGVPARQIIGHGSLNWTDEVSEDLDRNSFSICQFIENAPTETAVLSIVHIFEGVQRNGPVLCGPSVF